MNKCVSVCLVAHLMVVVMFHGILKKENTKRGPCQILNILPHKVHMFELTTFSKK